MNRPSVRHLDRTPLVSQMVFFKADNIDWRSNCRFHGSSALFVSVGWIKSESAWPGINTIAR